MGFPDVPVVMAKANLRVVDLDKEVSQVNEQLELLYARWMEQHDGNQASFLLGLSNWLALVFACGDHSEALMDTWLEVLNTHYNAALKMAAAARPLLIASEDWTRKGN